MRNLLIVEDNRIAGTLIRTKISGALDWNLFWARSLKDAIELLDQHQNNFFAALLDYRLPDADDGEAIQEVVSRGIPSIVFTATTSTHDIRAGLWKKNIVDYVVKDNAQSLNYITELLSRLEKNLDIYVLVADDSQSSRKMLSKLLKTHNYQVIEAGNGKEALKIIESQAGIRLVITDYSMPEMDGVKLTRRLRSKYGKDGVAVLGMTGDQQAAMGANFIKAGANDFINKSNFIIEEFYCRVSQCVETIERIAEIRELATTDPLTGLYNRRYFYETAEKIYASAKRQKRRLAFATIDIDRFKEINDTYGHQAGDSVLKQVAHLLKEHMQRATDLIARVGGEEFCVLADDIAPQHAYRMFEELRAALAEHSIQIKDYKKVKVTVSIGLCTRRGRALDNMLRNSDKFLYQAKHEGRNKTISDLTTPAMKKIDS